MLRLSIVRAELSGFACHTWRAPIWTKQRGKGDLSKLIMEAVSRTDLRLVPLITIHGRREPTVAKVTQIVMPNEIRRLIEHWSENRRCSMNELLNSALVANLPKTRSEHDTRSAPSNRATELGQMTAAQREAFFAKLLSLTGSGAMPSLRSREGSYCEYDSEVGGTVEITQDRRRFLVKSTAGGELIRLREVGKSPFLELSGISRTGAAVRSADRRTTPR